MSIIISGFPGIGKSWVASTRSDIIDLESSSFHNSVSANDGPAGSWTDRYVDEILNKYRTSDYQYILVSSHKSVRDELTRRGVPYLVVVPNKQYKDDYMKRYLRRGSSIELITTIYTNWDSWLDAIDKSSAPVIHLDSGEFLSTLLVDFRRDPEIAAMIK